jgi:hypothetical protein
MSTSPKRLSLFTNSVNRKAEKLDKWVGIVEKQWRLE